MKNYIKAVREFLENDVDVQAYTSNIHFLKVPKSNNTRPLIVFTEMWKQNPYNQEWWQDIFEVLFECVVDYEDSIKWRELRELLKVKLSSFRWELTADRNWTIAHLEDVNIWYDDKNDVVRRWSVYLFKTTRDFV